ncbi:MAG: hypothetical protein ACJ76H_04765 [Bacteriovoracaceae bacterium]
MIWKIALLFFSFSAFAFNKDFKTNNDRVPYEFQLLFTSMKLEVKTPIEKVQLVGICKELDDNLAFLAKEHVFLFLKSEVIKDTLEYKFAKVRQFDLTASLIDRLDRDLKKKEQYLNPFALWIWRSIIAELNLRREHGLITQKSFNARGFEGAKLNEALRFEKYLRYLMPWIDKMDALSPGDFNTLTKDVGWVILRRINDRSLLFKKFSSTAAGDTKLPLFNIPAKLLELNPDDIKDIQNEKLLPASLREEGAREKSEASEAVEKVTPTDMSPLSEEIDKIGQ